MTREKYKLIGTRFCAFYNGNLYPILIAALVLFGGITGTEVITMLLHAVVLWGAFLFSDSVKPILVSFLTFVYQISVKNAPFSPTYSDYYATSWRIYVLFLAGIIIFAGLLVFAYRNKIFSFEKLKKTPLLISTLVFSFGLLLNGIFSGEWIFSNLVFAFSNVAVYLIAYVYVYNGFSKNDRAESLGSYFSYIALLATFIISIELIHRMITNENTFTDGSINKVAMSLGWGIWNLIAVSLAILIPLLFYGVYKNRYPWLYFGAATLAYVMSVLTMSRNALIFASLAYAVCIVISSFVGKHKKQFRIITVSGIALVLIFAVVFFDKIYVLLADYFERGFSDNGRFVLWQGAFESFLENPVFGSGFHGLNIDTVQFSFLPKMAHQTVLQLLGATGIFGLLSYLYYRIKTALAVFKKPNLLKTMMALSILVLLLESLLDNFIFNVYPVFYYVVALAIISRSNEEENALIL